MEQLQQNENKQKACKEQPMKATKTTADQERRDKEFRHLLQIRI